MNDTLDPLGHHAVTCKFGGYVVFHHNRQRDTFFQSCHLAGLNAKLEVDSGLDHDHYTRPADVLLPNWICSQSAALHFTVVSPLNSTPIHEVGTTAGSAASSAELRKHSNNDAKCRDLDCICVPNLG